jgi:5,10-methenyltetrahydrofolate synthetase
MLDRDIRDWTQLEGDLPTENELPFLSKASETCAASSADVVEIKERRRNERKRLQAVRRTYAADERALATTTLLANLTKVCEGLEGDTIGLYWPIKGEIEICRWAARFAATRDIKTALPVVVARNSPLEFWQWRMGEPLTRGFWNIPVPANRNPVDPSILIIPLVGFYGNYRLGYGGGYFDRTLAARVPRPTAIGVGFEFCRLPDFTPLPHDIPMDFIVTDRAIYQR